MLLLRLLRLLRLFLLRLLLIIFFVVIFNVIAMASVLGPVRVTLDKKKTAWNKTLVTSGSANL